MKDNIAIYAITQQGYNIAKQLKANYPNSTLFANKNCYTDSEGTILLNSPFTKQIYQNWEQFRYHIFIISVGATIRLIKDLIVDKREDPAVICIDNNGNFIIPILSGHIGGANAFSKEIALLLNATPVITTASDTMNKINIDNLSKIFGWSLIATKKALIHCCSMIVNDKHTLIIDETNNKKLKEYLESFNNPNIKLINNIDKLDKNKYQAFVFIGTKNYHEIFPELKDYSIIYAVKKLVVGIGCDKNTPMETIEKGLDTLLHKNKLLLEAIAELVSVDQKKDEKGIIKYAKKNKIPFTTTSANKLKDIKGIENPSEVVMKYICTPSVAEAASLFFSKSSCLLVPKQKFNNLGKNMTCAVCIKE